MITRLILFLGILSLSAQSIAMDAWTKSMQPAGEYRIVGLMDLKKKLDAAIKVAETGKKENELLDSWSLYYRLLIRVSQDAACLKDEAKGQEIVGAFKGCCLQRLPRKTNKQLVGKQLLKYYDAISWASFLAAGNFLPSADGITIFCESVLQLNLGNPEFHEREKWTELRAGVVEKLNI